MGKVKPFKHVIDARKLFRWFVVPGGGGVLGLEKGTDCGPSAAELLLSRANNAKKGGCPVIIDDYRPIIGSGQICLY